MKKRIAIALAVLSIFTVLASCNRRDQYRDPVSTDPNAETTTPTTNAVTDQPDNPDETTGQDTETGTTPVNPGNPPSQEGMGNPYAGMSAEDLLVHYTETPKYVSQSGDIVVNTPYYYILCNGENGTGGKAYSKLTGNMVTLCGKMSEEFGNAILREQERMKNTSKKLLWISMIPSLILVVWELMRHIWQLGRPTSLMTAL